MSWWLDLSDDPPHAVQLLDGDPALIAVWTTPQTVQFYAQDTGASYGHLTVSAPPGTDEAWRDFLGSLRAPNNAYLPVVDTTAGVIYMAYDGRLSVYCLPDASLSLIVDGLQTALTPTGTVCAIDLDRELGTVGVLAADGQLHIYQQHVHIGDFPADASGDVVALLLPDFTGTIWIVSSARIQTRDLGGTLLHSKQPLAASSAAACTPDGALLVTADRDQAFLRVYDAELHLVRQGSAWNLWADSTQIQLLAAPPFEDALLRSLDVANDGTLVFALGGSLCLTHINQLTPVPRPRALF